MVPLDLTGLRSFLEALIAGFSVLGGGMAYLSGSYAATALADERSADFVARRVNEGLGEGFTLSRWLSIIAFTIMALA
ncbi:MAG TPA: hypothetical protein VNP96_08230 [Solirubrobacterales bacterium]|nr:hypothetical protein [Solirubrobacterales bacterium]